MILREDINIVKIYLYYYDVIIGDERIFADRNVIPSTDRNKYYADNAYPIDRIIQLLIALSINLR